MNYQEKINGCIERVYKYNYSQEPKHTKKLQMTIDRNIVKSRKNMNEDVNNLILVCISYFDLPPYMADRTKLIMAKMWTYPDNFHNIKYENVMLGVLMYVVYEDPKYDAIDFKKYCTFMLGVELAEKNIKQMYKAFETVRYLYKDVESEF